MDMTCERCQAPFKTEFSRQRFCSKTCWYAHHQGANNATYKRVEISCSRCGTQKKVIPYKLALSEFHYCSKTCSRAAHREKMRGERNGNWRGGAIRSRGESWAALRKQVREQQGNKCQNCGMANDEHRRRYRGQSLHVHHTEPFRLCLENDPSKLLTLCCGCHMRADALLRRQMTPEQKSLMAQRTKEAQAKGLDKPIDHRKPCPRCGKPKERKSKHCWDCNLEVESEARKLACQCPVCGGQMSNPHRKQCHACYLNRKRRLALYSTCSNCGVQLKAKKIVPSKCRPCCARENGKLTRGRGLKGSRQNIGHLEQAALFDR